MIWAKLLTGLNAKNCATIGATCEEVAKVIYDKASKNNFVFDSWRRYCIPIGTIPGLMKAGQILA